MCAWYINKMKNEKIIIYTDGSSLGNPGPGGWGAVVSLPDDSIVELGGGDKKTTNNRMELTATIRALEYVKDFKSEIILYTDSSYVINGITKWVEGWQANNWTKRDKTPVLNRDLWEELVSIVSSSKIVWRHVPGHSGLAGNERADTIAVGFAEGRDVKLYNGPRDGYEIDIFNMSYDESKRLMKSKNNSRSKAKAYSYLSLVDGEVMRHETWVECESRVKGKSGVKFRKTLNKEDEDAIIKEWNS